MDGPAVPRKLADKELHIAKIAQAERNAKFIWTLPRRSLSKPKAKINERNGIARRDFNFSC